MSARPTDFAYASHRARQEEVAAINARCESAAIAHRRLAQLYATQALIALAGG